MSTIYSPGYKSEEEEGEEEDVGDQQQQRSNSIAEQRTEDEEEEVEQQSQRSQSRISNHDNTNRPPHYLDEKIDELFHDLDSSYNKNSIGTAKSMLIRFSRDILKYRVLVRKYGLEPMQLEQLFDIIVTGKLSTPICEQLIQLLLPREKIPARYIIRIIANFSKKETDSKAIKNLLNWVILVYDLIDSIETIKPFYNVLFHYITLRSTRTSVCHLLYFLTRKPNVTPYRIRTLIDMIDREKDNKALLGLLTVYATYKPEIQVPRNIRVSEIFVFDHPDPQLAICLTNIKTYWGNLSDEGELILHKPKIQLPNAKKMKRKMKNDPMGSFEIMPSTFRGLDILAILKDVEDLPYSDQLDTVLEDRNIQHLLVCNPDEAAIERLGYWIGHKLLYLIRWNNSKDKGKQELQKLLQQLTVLTSFAKSQLPVIATFLKEYLKSWNGIEFQDEIFELITFVKPGNYEELYQDILLLLYRKYCITDVFWKAKLIMCYTEWLKNWALLDWKGHTSRGTKQKEDDADDVDKITWMFEGLSFDIDYFDTIQKLVEHVDRMCVMGFLAENDHPLIQHAALSFFELVANIPLQHDIPEIIIPAANFIHRTYFSSNAMAVSRICGIICRYKKTFEENDSRSDVWMSKHSTEYLHHFNTYMTDICNSLWRDKGLTKTNNAAISFALTEQHIEHFTTICENRGDEINRVLSITHSGALAGFSKRFMTRLEEQEGIEIRHDEPVTAESLKRLNEQGGLVINILEYRVEYLNYLHDMGLTGIHDLLYACMTTLINRKKAAEERENSMISITSNTTSSRRSRSSLNNHS